MLAAAIVTLLLSAALGCAGSEAGGESSTSDPASRASWYHRSRALDLTGDGRADSVRVEAVGTRADSLDVTLSIFVDGERKHQESWGSSYELAVVDSATRSRQGVETTLRARLDGVLASVALRPLGAGGMRLMAEDSAALVGIDPPPSDGVSFAYGYETTVRLAWDASRSRYVRLWSCC